MIPKKSINCFLKLAKGKESTRKCWINQKTCVIINLPSLPPVHSSYGTVYKALNSKTGEIVAIKMVPIEDIGEDTEKEIRIMKYSTSSEHLVKFYASYIVDGASLWVINYCNKGDAK